MEKIPDPHSKEEQWQKEKEVVDQITDDLGLEIDAGIKDTVIALHLLGINTSSSHEGKLDKYPIPYIDIESSEAEKLGSELGQKIDALMSEEEKFVRKEIDNIYDQLDLINDRESPEAKKLYQDIETLNLKLKEFDRPESDEVNVLEEKIETENLQEREKINTLLEEFYKNRNASDESKLIIMPQGWGRSRLQNQGAKIQENESNEDKKRERLLEFQAEMNAFTEFLKNSFFEEK